MIMAEPSLVGLEVGSVEWFRVQRQIIHSRPLLRRCYNEWYRRLLSDERSVPSAHSGICLEIGSGGSYLKDFLPSLITSDVVPDVADQVIDARALPFAEATVRAVFSTHVFHHVPDPVRFLSEASRVLVSGGVISMIEVAHTPLSRLLFGKFHPEPYDPHARDWDFVQNHAMINTNQALSWIVFFRDRAKFENLFPELQLEVCEYLPWVSYLAAGGVTRKPLLPAALEPTVLWLENLLEPLSSLCALHWHIRIRKKTTRAETPISS
jgi:SAM-dependent methyltransferase